MAAAVVATTIGPQSARPIALAANDQLVTCTTGILQWYPSPAIGGVPQMAVVLSEAVAAFTVRCKLSRTPLYIQATRLREDGFRSGLNFSVSGAST